MGQAGRDLLDDLSKRSKDDFGKSNGAEFKDYWLQRTAIQLQRCNANVLLKKSVMPCRDRLSAQTRRCSIEKRSPDPF